MIRDSDFKNGFRQIDPNRYSLHGGFLLLVFQDRTFFLVRTLARRCRSSHQEESISSSISTRARIRHTMHPNNLGRHAPMKREKIKVTLVFCSIIFTGAIFASNASAACSRETLQKLADTYVKAQTTGSATMLPLA